MHEIASMQCNDRDSSLVAQAFVAHVFAQYPSIRYETRNGHSHVIIDFEHLLIGAGQLILRSIESRQDNMGIALQSTGDFSRPHCPVSFPADLLNIAAKGPQGSLVVSF